MLSVSLSLSLRVGFVVLLAGCVATSETNDSSASQSSDLTGAPVAGLYHVKPGTADAADRWIIELNLHGDRTFEGIFGTNMSSASGHQFRTAGEYDAVASTTTPNETRITVTDTHVMTLGDEYIMRRTSDPDTIEMKFGGATSTQPWFTMTRQPAPIAIVFKEGEQPKLSGGDKLVAGQTALVMYAESRLHCAPQDPEWGYLAGFHQTNGAQQGWTNWGEAGAVKGYYRSLVRIDAGARDFAMWFLDHGDTCEHWDSNFGHNYHFAVR